MNIGVISDTHIPVRAMEIPEKVLEHLRDVDLILHAGDFIELKVLKVLEAIAPVEAVFGNMDTWEVRVELKKKRIITLGGVRIGLVHGFDIPWDTQRKIPKEFVDDHVQCVVYGHTHMPRNEFINGVLYFNPGSATDKILSFYNTVGILKIEKGKIKGRIIRIK